MSNYSKEEMDSIINQAINARNVKEVDHTAQRLTLLEDSMMELKDMFKEHIIKEHESFKQLHDTIASMRDEIHEMTSTMREQKITAGAELKECSANLRRDIMQEVYKEFEKRTDKHNDDVDHVLAQHKVEIDKVWKSLRGTNDKVTVNEKALEKLMGSHAFLQKIQYVVGAALVGAILKSIGVM